MVSSRLFVVFILPIIFSVVAGTVVMADILQKPDRELNMWPMTFSGESTHGKSSHGSGIEIIGLSNQYTVSEPVQIQVKINGNIPQLISPPTGCRFHPRCKYAEKICSEKIPALETVGKNHLVSCHRWKEIKF